MIEEDPPDPTEQQGSVGGGDQNHEIPNLPEAHQPSPTDSLPDFDVIGLPDGVLTDEIKEEIPASPMTPEAQIEQIEADGALAEQLQADEQMVADGALAQQLQEPTSVTLPKPWPVNPKSLDQADTPGARGSRDIQLPDPNDPAAHQQLLTGNSVRQRRTNSQRRSEPPPTKLGHRHQLRLLLRAAIQFNFPLSTSSQLLGTNPSKMTRRLRKEQLEQGQLTNIVLDYALNSNYSVSMYCAYLALGELQFNSNIINHRHAGKVDHEHPITGMLRYFALIKRARPPKSDGSSEPPYHEFRYMEAILTKVAVDQRIELTNNDELELALHGEFSPSFKQNRLPSPSGFADARSDSDNSDDEERIPTDIFEDEVEESDLPARRTNSPPSEWPRMNEEQAKIIDQGIDVWRFAPKGLSRPKILDHQDISDYEREGFLKLCSKSLLRCLRHEVPGCNIAMQPGGWVPVSEATRGLSREFNDHDSQNPKRDLLCVLGFANRGILPNSYEPYPRIQLKCVQKGYTPDNPEMPEQARNFMGINMGHLIPFHGATAQIVITHMRAGHGMTRRESRNSPVPNRVWNTTDYTPANEETLQRSESFADTASQKMEIPYAGSKLQTQRIDFDMTEYVIHWTKAASFPILLATGLVDNAWKIKETGFNPFEVKNEIFFHRVAVKHNQLTNSPLVLCHEGRVRCHRQAAIWQGNWNYEQIVNARRNTSEQSIPHASWSIGCVPRPERRGLRQAPSNSCQQIPCHTNGGQFPV